MKIELRKISHSKSLSEETPAYTADLYVDGVLFANVSNRGHGGCDMQYPAKGKTHKDVADLCALIKSTYPPVKTNMTLEGKPFEYEQSLESVCHGLLDRWELEKIVKRDLTSKVMFIKDDGKLYQIKAKAGTDQQTKTIQFIRAKGHKVLNELPFAEAVAAYETATA